MTALPTHPGRTWWPWVVVLAVIVVAVIVVPVACLVGVSGRYEIVRLPTSAMHPTLRGASDQWPGDLVLVDRAAYEHDEPQRWDVAVFLFPLNRSRRFIKRVVGLPGEHLRIHDGDIWIRPRGALHGDIPQRTREVRLAHATPIYPYSGPPEDRPDEASYWKQIPASEAWTFPSSGVLAFGGGARASLRSRHPILAHTTADSWATTGSPYGELVRDVRVSCTILIPAGATLDAASALRIAWRSSAQTVATVELTPSQGTVSIEHTDAPAIRKTLEARLQAGTSLACELEFVDARLYLWLGGTLVAALHEERRFDPRDEEDEDPRYVEFTAGGASLTIDGLEIHRDLRHANAWYANREAAEHGIDIPENAYFVLGDNTHNSSDSRRWHQVDLPLQDGSIIQFDHADDPEEITRDGGRGIRRVVDIHGNLKTWSEEDEDHEHGSDVHPAPFVYRRDFVGKAVRVVGPGPEHVIR